MTSVVLDCSVAMAWCFEDECDAYADGVLDSLSKVTALVPSIWPIEITNVLLTAERRSRLTKADSARFLELLHRLPITVVEFDWEGAAALLSRGREVRLSAYDTCYLDLAMRRGVPVATRDRALRAACRKGGVPVFAAD